MSLSEPEGFTPMAADDWPVLVVDTWPAGRLRRSAMEAYDRLARRGEIVPVEALRLRGGAVVVRYRSQIPQAWVHDLLRKEEYRQAGRS